MPVALSVKENLEVTSAFLPSFNHLVCCFRPFGSRDGIDELLHTTSRSALQCILFGPFDWAALAGRVSQFRRPSNTLILPKSLLMRDWGEVEDEVFNTLLLKKKSRCMLDDISTYIHYLFFTGIFAGGSGRMWPGRLLLVMVVMVVTQQIGNY